MSDVNKIDYASTIMYELYQSGTQFRIKTIYNGTPMTFSECKNEEFCYFDDFFSHMADRLVLDEVSLKQ